MTSQLGSADFLKFVLWKDIDINYEKLPKGPRRIMDIALDQMAEVNGKPDASSMTMLYDALMQTEETAVYCHAMMFSRIYSSTDWIAERLSDGETVLDLGTCTGHQVFYWAYLYNNSRFIGIDVSSNAIKLANKWRDDTTLKDNIEFRVDNYLRPDFDEGTGTLDVIVNCFTMETMQEHLSMKCALPDWMLKALKEDGRLIAVLTVENWTKLDQIIEQWRSQGLKLNEIAMISTGDGASHPGLVMSRVGDDLQIDVIDWVIKTIAENRDGLWMIHNPVDEYGNSGANPFEYTHEDLAPIANQIQYPMRIETWVADAPKIHPDSLPASPYQPVIELRHPDWEMDGYPLAVWMDWYERDGEPQSRYRIVFHENPEISEELRMKLEVLNRENNRALKSKILERNQGAYERLATFVEEISNGGME